MHPTSLAGTGLIRPSSLLGAVMTKRRMKNITHQAVGAFGEKAAEAELLRHGWIPANVNATVKNAAKFDIYALKGNRTVHLRVKTCGPNVAGFQFGGLPSGGVATTDKISGSDFTILVRMGDQREKDQFYIVPTAVVQKEIALRKKDYLKSPKRDGSPRKDTGHWTLRLCERKDGREEGGWGLVEKWRKYLGGWSLLDGQ